MQKIARDLHTYSDNEHKQYNYKCFPTSERAKDTKNINKLNFSKCQALLGKKKPRAAFIPGRVVGRGRICVWQGKMKLAHLLPNFEWLHVGWHDCSECQGFSATEKACTILSIFPAGLHQVCGCGTQKAEMRAEKLIKSFSLSHMWLFPNSKAVVW